MTEEFLLKRPSRERWRHIFTSTCALASMAALLPACFEPLCRNAEIPDLNSMLGNEVFVGTIKPHNRFESSCGMTGTPESAFRWTAPSSGWYRFDTAHSNVDTVLSVWTGDVCLVTELACNDDEEEEPSTSSVVTVRLVGGEAVYLMVESYSGTTGQVVINIHELLEQECADTRDDDNDDLIDCADPDCGCECPNGMLSPMLDKPLSGTTAGGNDLSAGSCGRGSAPDDNLVWTPPSTGRYRISTEGSTFDTVLYVQQGDVCGGPELGCNDDKTSGLGWSALELSLEGGRPVIITVDGYGDSTGDYNLDITRLSELNCSDATDDDGDGAIDCNDDDCDCTCPSEELGSLIGSPVHVGSTVGRLDLDAGSCGGDGAPDASFAWTAPRAGAFRIGIEDSTFDTVLYVQEGNACGGAEVECNYQTFWGESSDIILVLDAGNAVVITVDGQMEQSGDFTLDITDVTEVQESSCIDGKDTDVDGTVDCDDADCDCTCPMDDLGVALGELVSEGSTELRGNLDSGECGGKYAPDASFVWTAPQTATYRIHTGGSSFDTVLYVKEGDVCGGVEVACNDDDPLAPRSQVELDLMAGETVVITVDGFSDNAGSFVLNVECLTCM